MEAGSELVDVLDENDPGVDTTPSSVVLHSPGGGQGPGRDQTGEADRPEVHCRRLRGRRELPVVPREVAAEALALRAGGAPPLTPVVADGPTVASGCGRQRRWHD